ncbi:ABC transporter ATP-binding protein [Clostridium gasigenes]|uniref:ABC transporter ATP-binding protein n=1 Tax=Clostridium gasigenes TaxID=94869 RepID=A0A1H0UQB7_9CLOT|nr:ABC transporter ATP-binding protein [Clostridium gasigenes]MBB6715889.1 ABC transporter ATP-binding protein [Clostridium gasigenes]SDP68273.1 lipoprotein-releasing system ATP-binding protein [Clostridium gasigenes]
MIIKLESVKKIYGETIKNTVLKGINLEIEKGTFNAIIGQSGSGKSTLLNIMGTLDKESEGEVYINGVSTKSLSKNDISALRNKEIGFIFQFHHLLPEFNAIENIMMPALIEGVKDAKTISKRAEFLLDKVGLLKLKNNMALNLSGGQQQRVAIARALMNSPEIILADEPTGNLDSDTTMEIYNLLREINKEFGTTFIIITHDNRIASLADRIIEIENGEIAKD